MTQYSGLFIGGPLDGQTLTHDTPYYRVMERMWPDQLSWHPSHCETTQVTCRTWTYSHVKNVVMDKHGSLLDCWVLDTVRQSPQGIVRYLIDRYAMLAQKNVRLVEKREEERRRMNATSKSSPSSDVDIYSETSEEDQALQRIWAS